MKIVGLITEYNPFHNGHLYHMEKAREMTGADAVVVVMSGDFVQRGEPAVMPKRLRTQAALSAGASVILELPVCYAAGSAEFFAEGAIALLDSLGCVDTVCFGSECGEIEILRQIAEILAEEPMEYQELLRKNLKEGRVFPKARQDALSEYLHSLQKSGNREMENMDVTRLESILEQPNNILGIEYLKALHRRNSPVKACTVQRIASGYHESQLQESTGISSASAIRRALADRTFDQLKSHVPESCKQLLEEEYAKRYPVWPEDFSLLLKYKLLTENRNSLVRYADVTEELANRIMNSLKDYTGWRSFCELLKTKELTYARISRSLLHILLNITDEEMRTFRESGSCFYAHILGFRMEDVEVLKELKTHTNVPLITKLADGRKILDEKGQKMLDQDRFASDLYESVVTEKYHTEYICEYQQQIVRI